MLNDLDLALQCQSQYNGKIPIKTVAEVNFSVIHNPDAIDIVFQGTASWQDAQRDLEALMINCSFGRVHEGAWRGISQVIDKICNQIYLYDGKLIRCSGHSLGSMEAALAKRELYQRGLRNLEAIGFEPPHYGDVAAVAYSGNDNERAYQNYKDLFVNDIFTMIPPHLILEPYVPWMNIERFWSPPTAQNEWHDAPYNVQCHSLSDCCIAYLKTQCVPSNTSSS